MTRRLLTLTAVSFALTLTAPAHAEKYKYNELQIKDYDEMLTLVRNQTQKAQKILKSTQSNEGEEAGSSDQEAIDLLRGGLLLVLSRPNQDNMLGKLMPEVRKELANLNAFEDALSSLVSEAIDAFKIDKLLVVYKSTYLFVLENVLAEFKPEVKGKEDLRKIFQKIADANIKIPDDVRKDLKLRSMLKIDSPSDRAKKILSDVAKQTAAEAAKTKK